MFSSVLRRVKRLHLLSTFVKIGDSPSVKVVSVVVTICEFRTLTACVTSFRASRARRTREQHQHPRVGRSHLSLWTWWPGHRRGSELGARLARTPLSACGAGGALPVRAYHDLVTLRGQRRAHQGRPTGAGRAGGREGLQGGKRNGPSLPAGPLGPRPGPHGAVVGRAFAVGHGRRGRAAHRVQRDLVRHVPATTSPPLPAPPQFAAFPGLSIQFQAG